MILMTLTFRDTQHQIMLGFKQKSTLAEALKLLPAEDQGDMEAELKDDYNQTAVFIMRDLIAMEVADVEDFCAFRNELRMIRAEGEQTFQTRLGQRPDLKFFVGQDVNFGDRS